MQVDEEKEKKRLKNTESLNGSGMSGQQDDDSSYPGPSPMVESDDEPMAKIWTVQYKLTESAKEELYAKIAKKKRTVPIDEMSDYGTFTFEENHNQFLVEPEISPYVNEDFTMIPLVYHSPFDGLPGLGILDKWAPQQDLVTLLFHVMGTTARRSTPINEINVSKLAGTTDAKQKTINNLKMSNIPPAFVEVNENGAIKRVEQAGIPPELFALFRETMNSFQRLAGDVSADALNPQTAAAVNAISGLLSVQLSLDKIETQNWLKRVIRNAYQIRRSRLGRDDLFRPTMRDEETGEVFVFRKALSKKQLQDEADLELEFEPTVEIDPTTKANQMQVLWANLVNFLDGPGRAKLAGNVAKSYPQVDEETIRVVTESMMKKSSQLEQAQAFEAVQQVMGMLGSGGQEATGGSPNGNGRVSISARAGSASPRAGTGRTGPVP